MSTEPTPEQIARWERRYEVERRGQEARASLERAARALIKAIEGIASELRRGFEKVADSWAAEQRRRDARRAAENDAYRQWKNGRGLR